MGARQDTVGTALVDAVRERRIDVRPFATGEAWRQLRARSEFHGVTGHLRAAVDPAAVPVEVRSWLAYEAHRDHVETSRTMAGLQGVGAALGPATPWLVLKGPAVAALHRDPSLRRSVDLDVLVRPVDLADAVDALVAAGAVLLDEHWTQLRLRRTAQVGLRLPDGGLLDLHWHLVNDFEVRDAFRIPTATLFDDASTRALWGRRFPTLGTTDTLLHLAVHAATAGGHRLVWLKDIERAVASLPVDWDEVVSRARAWRVHLVLAVMLRRAARVLDAEVPAEVVAGLDPVRLWSVLVTLGDGRRIAAGQRQRSATRLATRATRRSTPRSLGLLAWRAVRAAATRPPRALPDEDERPDALVHVVSARPPGPCRLGRGDPDVAVSVAVVTHDSAAVVGGLLTSLPTAVRDGRVEVIVVDNDSRDTTPDVVEADPRVTVVRAGRNEGFAAGINRALAIAHGAAVLVVNPDARLRPGALDALVDGLRQDPDAGIAVPRIDGPDGRRMPSLRRRPTLLRAVGEAVLGGERAGHIAPLGELVVDDRSYARSHHVDWASGAVMLVSRDCLIATGAWDERFFLYSEETDYQLRAAEQGFRVRYVPTAVAVHIGGDQQRSPALWSLAATNRVRAYGKRHGPVPTHAYRAALTGGEAVRALTGRDTSRAATAALWRWREEVA